MLDASFLQLTSIIQHLSSTCCDEKENNKKAPPCHPLAALDKLSSACHYDMERFIDLLGK